MIPHANIILYSFYFFRREKYLKNHFQFLIPERVPIGTYRGQESFYYYISAELLLQRLMTDNSLRKYFIINTPVFSVQNVSKLFLFIICKGLGMSFSKSPILKMFLWKFHGLVLGLVELIDAKGNDVAQPTW